VLLETAMERESGPFGIVDGGHTGLFRVPVVECGVSDRARSFLDLLVRCTYLFDRAAVSDVLSLCIEVHVLSTLN
jgi:hypothetical protein